MTITCLSFDLISQHVTLNDRIQVFRTLWSFVLGYCAFIDSGFTIAKYTISINYYY